MIFTVTGCVFIFAFASLVGIARRITRSAVGLDGWIIKRKSINNKKKKKRDKTELLRKSKLKNKRNLNF